MDDDDLTSTRGYPAWFRKSVVTIAVCNLVASTAAIGFTAYVSWNANRLQQGDNTINVIAAYGGPAVRESRRALYELPERRIVDPSRYALSFSDLSPLRGALGFVATCYRDGLCLGGTVIDYFCVDVIKYDDLFGSGAPDFQPVAPEGADVAFAQLVADCRDQLERESL